MGAAAENAVLIKALGDLLPTLFGKKGGTQVQETSGGGKTEQTIMSKEAVDGMLRSFMQGTRNLGLDGNTSLADVMGAQKKFGMYNTTNSSLYDAAYKSNIAALVAEKGAPKVTTEAPITKSTRGIDSQSGIMKQGSILPLLLGAAAWSQRKKIKDIFDGFGSNEGTLSESELSKLGEIETEPLKSTAEYLGYTPTPVVSSDMATESAAYDVWAGTGDSASSILDYTPAMEFASSGAEAIPTMFADQNIVDMWDSVGIGSSDFLSAQTDSYSSLAATGADVGFDFGMPGIGSMFNLASGNNPDGMAGESAALSMIPVVGPALALANSLDVPVVSDVVDAGGDAVTWLGNQIGCFITTAILHARGDEDDNSPELQTLRHFRDSWLLANHPEDIDEYYRIAPTIVSGINSRTDSDAVWNLLYRGFLNPALRAISIGDSELAYKSYKAMVVLAQGYATDATETQIEKAA